MYVLCGKSGSGKSTLLHLVARVIKEDSGSILYDGQPLQKDDISLVMQTPFFFGDLTVLDNILIPTLFAGFIKKRHITKYASYLQISHILKQKICYCSGGEKARTNLLRGILINKKVLLVDEPTAHLDFENSQLIGKLLGQLARKIVVIITTHQPEFFKFENTIFLKLKNAKLEEDMND